MGFWAANLLRDEFAAWQGHTRWPDGETVGEFYGWADWLATKGQGRLAVPLSWLSCGGGWSQNARPQTAVLPLLAGQGSLLDSSLVKGGCPCGIQGGPATSCWGSAAYDGCRLAASISTREPRRSQRRAGRCRWSGGGAVSKYQGLVLSAEVVQATMALLPALGKVAELLAKDRPPNDLGNAPSAEEAAARFLRDAAP